jgi:transposase
MDVMFTHGAGLDAHNKSVTACRTTRDLTGQQAEGLVELKDFGTMANDLLALSDWLSEAGIIHVAMESAGEYWKPVFNLLKGLGRKTDKPDARWLAKQMRYGLLQASFIPLQGQWDLRDLTRYGTKLVQERSWEGNRVQGVLERANIKLAVVASDMMGVAGRAMPVVLIEGRTAWRISTFWTSRPRR